jgi:hypothetical protein
VADRSVDRVLGIGPDDVASMPREAMPALLTELAAIQAAAAALLLSAPTQNGDHDGPTVPVEQAAAMASVTVDQFYRRKRFRPAIVTLGHRTKVVNVVKLRRILSLGA